MDRRNMVQLPNSSEGHLKLMVRRPGSMVCVGCRWERVSKLSLTRVGYLPDKYNRVIIKLVISPVSGIQVNTIGNVPVIVEFRF